MADKQEASVPTSIAMLIGEINGTIKSEFNSLKSDIQSLRNDLSTVREDHEKRLGLLEQAQGERKHQVKQFEVLIEDVEGLKTWRATREGNWAGANWAGNIGKMLLGAGITVAVYLGAVVAHPAKQAPADHSAAQAATPSNKPL